MRRFLIAIVTLTSLCGWILTSPTRAVPPQATTTTALVLPVNQFLGGAVPPLTLIQGNLEATFEATAHPSGWVVRATFRSDGLTLSGGTTGNVSGRATGSIGLPTGATGTLYATKLNISGGNGRLYVECSIVVDADGVVTVQQYSLDFLTSGGGGPCIGC